NPWRFGGEYWDFYAQMYYLRARNFNPRTGRFSQPDPLFHVMHGNLQGSVANILQAGNLFVFCINNPVMWVDPSGLVIQLAGTAEQRETILSYMQTLTDHRLGTDADGIVYISSRATRNIQFANGNALIERMIASEHVTRIIITDDRNAFYHRNRYNAMIPGVGAGGTIHFNPSVDAWTFTLNNSGYSHLTSIPANIVLAHELIHADRAMRGVNLGQDRVSHTIRVRVDRMRISVYRIFGSTTRLTNVRHRISQEEMATIGLRLHVPGDITENMIRGEHGLRPRTSHRGEFR
ncbi:MAG: M91 family zinc metallopeptidase, partial [Defluviitaleaceae bacterium]|nr:M91 family zinc metallopeptidase [Defluviitaleaceae bacterium]